MTVRLDPFCVCNNLFVTSGLKSRNNAIRLTPMLKLRFFYKNYGYVDCRTRPNFLMKSYDHHSYYQLE